MKWLVYSLILSSFLTLPSQAQDKAFKVIDKHAHKAPESLRKSLSALTAYLVQPANSELERVRSIYTWITHNISYDQEALKKVGRKRINRTNLDILSRKKAICLGYSTLFRDMCLKAGIRCEVISGYSKGTLTSKPDLETPDHAWNAVEIDGEWHILDATWGSSLLNATNDFVLAFNEGYFLTSPDRFIVNHLPADPMWQLLDCPIPPQLFLAPADSILHHLEGTAPCQDFRDSIRQYMALEPKEKKLQEALNTFRYLPTKLNKKALAQVYMDLVSTLSDTADLQQQANELPAMIHTQERMIDYCYKAKQLAKLYNWQLELFISTLINQATARAKQIETIEDRAIILEQYQQVLTDLEASAALIEELPASSFKNYAKEATVSYLDIINHNLKRYQGRK